MGVKAALVEAIAQFSVSELEHDAPGPEGGELWELHCGHLRRRGVVGGETHCLTVRAGRKRWCGRRA